MLTLVGGLLLRHFPEGNQEEVWQAFSDMLRKCDPDGAVGTADCPIAGEWSGRVPCMYGIVSACACVVNMFVHHREFMSPWEAIVANYSSGLRDMLWGSDKLLEFLDSSTWPFTVADVAAVVASFELWGEESPRQRPPALHDGHPWAPGSPAFSRAASAAEGALEAVASWTWPPAHARLPRPAGRTRPEAPPPPGGLRGGRQRLRIWAYGTHCSVVAEPISALALLFKEEFHLEVTWRGTKDYCRYHSGSWPVPQVDEGSAVSQVTRSFLRKQGRYWDMIQEPRRFATELHRAMQQDAALLAADLALCSEPAFACAVLHEAGKALLGYFGVHVGFMLSAPEDQLAFYQDFRDRIVKDPRSTFATSAPYLSWQVYRHTSVRLPAVRPLSLYTLPAAYAGSRESDVLVSKRNILLWDLAPLLEDFARVNSQPWHFIDASELYRLGQHSFQDWADFRAAVYFPYDWLQTMTFYDWLAMALPTFVPDSPFYSYAWGTNSQDAWTVVLEENDTAGAQYPYHYGDWLDLESRVHWWLLTDFSALPGLVHFSSVGSLLSQLASREALRALSGQLRQAHVERLVNAAPFWHGAALRALGAA